MADKVNFYVPNSGGIDPLRGILMRKGLAYAKDGSGNSYNLSELTVAQANALLININAIIVDEEGDYIQTAIYSMTMPDNLPAGRYTLVYRSDNNFSVGAEMGSVEINWLGSSEEMPQSGDSYLRLGAPAGASISADITSVPNALLDLASAVDGKTVRQALQIIAAVLAGKVSGAGSGTETFRSLDDENNRVVVTTDLAGNRTSVIFP